MDAAPITWSFELNDSSGLVVSRPDHASLYILNHSARFLWCSLQDGTPQNLLVERFAEHFGILPHQAAADVASTLDDWSQTLLAPATTVVTSPPAPVPSSGAALFSCDYSLRTTSFRLLAYDRDFVDEIRPRLAHLAIPAVPSPNHIFHVFRTPDDLLQVCRGEAFLAVEPDSAAIRIILLQEIARLGHHPETQYLAVLHAAACASPSNGRAIILPAATNSGKSTLTAALLHSGLHFLSDDSAAIHHLSRQVIPLPFALMLREGSWPILTPSFPELTSTPTFYRNGDHVRFLPPFNPSGPAVAQCLLFSQYSPAAGDAHLQPLSTFETLCSLQKSGFWVPHTCPAIAAFLSWVQSLPAYQLNYSNLHAAIPIIHQLLDSPLTLPSN